MFNKILNKIESILIRYACKLSSYTPIGKEELNEYFLEAVKTDSRYLKLIPKEYWTKDLVTLAINNNPLILNIFSKEQRTYEFTLMAMFKHLNNFKEVVKDDIIFNELLNEYIEELITKN